MKAIAKGSARYRVSGAATCAVLALGLGVLHATAPADETNQPPQPTRRTALQALHDAGKVPKVEYRVGPGVRLGIAPAPRGRITVIQAIRQRWGEEGLRKYVRVQRSEDKRDH
jgi:hypothetical protein